MPFIQGAFIKSVGDCGRVSLCYRDSHLNHAVLILNPFAPLFFICEKLTETGTFALVSAREYLRIGVRLRHWTISFISGIWSSCRSNQRAKVHFRLIFRILLIRKYKFINILLTFRTRKFLLYLQFCFSL